MGPAHIDLPLAQIDLPGAEPERAIKQIQSAFELDTSSILQVKQQQQQQQQHQAHFWFHS
jgi:translation elongation factor EF-4